MKARLLKGLEREAALMNSEATAFRRPERVPFPRLPAKGRLRSVERWQSLLWSIEAASQHGPDALRGLTIALAHVIQGEVLEALIFDAREHSRHVVDPWAPLWKPDLPLNAAGQTMDDLMVRRKTAIKVNLEDAAVFPHPWERWRLHRALGNMGTGRPWKAFKQSHNHFAVGWWPWPIVLVRNGNHSTLAAQLRGGGRLTCEESYDFSPVLRVVRTDGMRWYRADDGSSLGRVKSMAMAAIFVVGQRLLDAM